MESIKVVKYRKQRQWSPIESHLAKFYVGERESIAHIVLLSDLYIFGIQYFSIVGLHTCKLIFSSVVQLSNLKLLKFHEN